MLLCVCWVGDANAAAFLIRNILQVSVLTRSNKVQGQRKCCQQLAHDTIIELEWIAPDLMS
jgi:hypothetical protein